MRHYFLHISVNHCLYCSRSAAMTLPSCPHPPGLPLLPLCALGLRWVLDDPPAGLAREVHGHQARLGL